jgi:tetratricopeptide (TPR) repeat protein
MKEKAEAVEKVRQLIISFAKDRLTQEEEDLCLYYWLKLTRKRKLEVTRGRPDIWAAGVVWAFCRTNFKYEEDITIDSVCAFFNNKKSSVGTRAREILDLLGIDYFDPEFSTRRVMENSPFDLSLDTVQAQAGVPQQKPRPVTPPDARRLKADEAISQGFELLHKGDRVGAGRYFFESAEIDPTYAEPYTCLAQLAWLKGDLKQAEKLSRKALEIAEPYIKKVPRGEYWDTPDSRSYLQAMHNLAVVLWDQRRLAEALDLFTLMLKLDADDNKGARFQIGPLYHEMGDLKKAAEWYDQTSEAPRSLFNLSLILAQQNQTAAAALNLIMAIFENPYITPLLLHEKIPDTDWQPDSHFSEPQYAEDYVNDYGDWWKKHEPALKLLKAVWHHGTIQRMLLQFFAAARVIQQTGKGDLQTTLSRTLTLASLKKLVSEICAGLKDEPTGQMKLM